MIRQFRLPAAMLAVLWAAGCATVSLDPPTCPTDASVDELVAKYRARQPAPNPPASMTADGAACGRDKFTARLAADSGRVVGYKAGLTNSAVQKRFNYPAPVRGTLFGGLANSALTEPQMTVLDPSYDRSIHPIIRTRSEFLISLVELVDRARVSSGELRRLRHDGAQHGVDVESRIHRPTDIAERLEFLNGLSQFGRPLLDLLLEA